MLTYSLFGTIKSFTIIVNRKQLFDLYEEQIKKELINDYRFNGALGILNRDWICMSIQKINEKEFKLNAQLGLDRSSGNGVDKKFTFDFSFPSSIVLETIISMVLKENNIVQCANMNTPIEGFSFVECNLKKDVEQLALKFTFKVTYDDQSNYK